MAEPGLERRHAPCDLGRARERELLPARAEGALQRREGPRLRLPRRVVGEAALHLKQLVPLQPGAERALDRRAVARHHAGGRECRRSDEPHQRPAPGLDESSGLLLEQRLLEVARRDADLPAERQDFVPRQPVADVALAGLKLGGALDDALERLPADQLARHPTL